MVLNTVFISISLPPFFIRLSLDFIILPVNVIVFFYFSFVKCFSKRSN